MFVWCQCKPTRYLITQNAPEWINPTIFYWTLGFSIDLQGGGHFLSPGCLGSMWISCERYQIVSAIWVLHCSLAALRVMFQGRPEIVIPKKEEEKIKWELKEWMKWLKWNDMKWNEINWTNDWIITLSYLFLNFMVSWGKTLTSALAPSEMFFFAAWLRQKHLPQRYQTRQLHGPWRGFAGKTAAGCGR